MNRIPDVTCVCRSSFEACHRRLLAALLMLAMAGPTMAETPLPLYGELQIAKAGVRVSEVDFNPLFGSVTVGTWVSPGIGIEAFADGRLGDDEEAGLELEVSRALGLALRLESPPLEDLSGYITLGYVDYELAQELADGSGEGIDENFTGVRASVGFVQRLRAWPGVLVSAEYRHYNADESVHVDAFMLGLRFSRQ